MPTVLILGATSEVSAALARRFAREKYAIQLAARRPEQLGPLQSDLAIRSGAACTVHRFDATDFASHEAFFAALDPIPDCVVCVFGTMHDEEAAFEDWSLARGMIDTNFTGAVSILNIAARNFIARRHGDIVGISSVAGERGRASKLVYGASKAGFTAYLSGLRNKCAAHRVHVMSVIPGFLYTRMTENMKLPALLTAKPAEAAEAIFRAYVRRANVLYVKWMWRYIMAAIRAIPEFQFKKMKL